MSSALQLSLNSVQFIFISTSRFYCSPFLARIIKERVAPVPFIYSFSLWAYSKLKGNFSPLGWQTRQPARNSISWNFDYTSMLILCTNCILLHFGKQLFQQCTDYIITMCYLQREDHCHQNIVQLHGHCSSAWLREQELISNTEKGPCFKLIIRLWWMLRAHQFSKHAYTYMFGPPTILGEAQDLWGYLRKVMLILALFW